VRQEGVAAQAVGSMSKALLFANRSLLPPTVGSKVHITPARSIFFAKNDLGELYFYFLKSIFLKFCPKSIAKHKEHLQIFSLTQTHKTKQKKIDKENGKEKVHASYLMLYDHLYSPTPHPHRTPLVSDPEATRSRPAAINSRTTPRQPHHPTSPH
jgi:hypothetical protein